mmetsp:Transcript_26386/g.54756  ORF Transcript_26386/g.54756 Transcript_26386/m.54756 type:complete len:250 (-) Transcript_26386:38-787(-)
MLSLGHASLFHVRVGAVELDAVQVRRLDAGRVGHDGLVALPQTAEEVLLGGKRYHPAVTLHRLQVAAACADPVVVVIAAGVHHDIGHVGVGVGVLVVGHRRASGGGANNVTRGRAFSHAQAKQLDLQRVLLAAAHEVDDVLRDAGVVDAGLVRAVRAAAHLLLVVHAIQQALGITATDGSGRDDHHAQPKHQEQDAEEAIRAFALLVRLVNLLLLISHLALAAALATHGARRSEAHKLGLCNKISSQAG